MKKIILTAMILAPALSFGQMVNYGFMAGMGLGGPKGNGLNIKTGPNMEYGFVFKYNFTEKTSVRTFINLEFHKFTLKEGREIEDPYITPPIIGDAADYLIKSTNVTQHIDFTYIVNEEHLDFSGGLYWGMNFIQDIGLNEKRIFYDVSDNEIINQSYAPNVYFAQLTDSEDSKSEYYTSDQVRSAMKGINTGIYVAATAGSESLKLSLRFDKGLLNYYSLYSSKRKLTESYFRIGVIYFFNS